MARNFVRTSSHYLSNSSPCVTAYPFSVSAMVRPASNPANASVWIVSDTASAAGYVDLISVSGTPRITVNGSNAATATASMSLNTWYNLIGTFASSTSRTVYLNGVNSGTASGSASFPGGTDVTNIGRRIRTSADNYWDGDIADVAVWDIALDAADIRSLGVKWYSPLLVRPESLVAHWELMGRASPEPDYVGKFAMAVTSATQSSHPAIIRPHRPRIIIPSAAPPPATFIPYPFSRGLRGGVHALSGGLQ